MQLWGKRGLEFGKTSSVKRVFYLLHILGVPICSGSRF